MELTSRFEFHIYYITGQLLIDRAKVVRKIRRYHLVHSPNTPRLLFSLKSCPTVGLGCFEHKMLQKSGDFCINHLEKMALEAFFDTEKRA